MNLPAQPPAGEDAPAHDAFISYSRRDTAFAGRLQQVLEKYTPPAGIGRERRRLRVFRDEHDFTGTEYHAAIQRHLAGARKLIVICSPDAASSPYVGDEVERFVALHGPENVVPVLWRGLPNNEVAADAIAERAFPPALMRELEMPLAADFRGADPRSRRFLDGAGQGAWMLLLANLLDVGRAEIERRELRRRRQRRRVWGTGIGAVFTALLALTIWALFEGERALGRQLAAEAALPGELDAERVERRVLLGRESVHRLARLGQSTLEAESALREALAQTPRLRLSLPAGQRVVAFAADGNHLLAAEGDRLRVHPLAGGALPLEVPLERPLRFLTAGADLRFVAGIDDGGRVRFWSWPGMRPVTPLPPRVGAAPVQCLTFARGGSEAVALRADPDSPADIELLHWTVGDSALIGRAAVPRASVRPEGAVRAGAGESCLRVRGHEQTTDEVAVASLDPIPGADESAPASTALTWGLRRPGALVPSGSDSASLRVWRGVARAEADHNAAAVLLLPDGRLDRGLPGAAGGVQVVPRWSAVQDLAPGGAWLATSQGLEDPYVPLLKSTRFDIVDTSNGVVVRSVGDHAGWARFTPDAATLVTVAGARLRLWDRAGGDERLRLFASAPVEHVTFDPSSRQLAAIAADGTLEVFEIGGPDETARAAETALLEPIDAAGELAVAGGRRLLLTGDDGRPPRAVALDGFAERMRASPDGRWIALVAAGEKRMLPVGEAPDARLLLVGTAGTPRVRWQGPSARQLRFDGASRRLLAVDDSGGVRMLDPEGGSLLWERRLDPPRAPAYVPPGEPRYAVSISDDAAVVAIGGADGLVLLSGQDGRPLRRDTVPALAVALSADGGLLARLSAGDDLWVERASDGRQVARLDRRGVAGIRELMFSPGGRRLLAFGGTRFSTFMGGGMFVEEHLQVWDVESGRPELRLPGSRIDADDYQASVGARADERRQLSGLVWNAHTRELAGMLYPSMLAYWTVPSSMVRARLTAWRLTDDGLVEIYRGGESSGITTEGIAAAGGALLVGGEDGYLRLIDLSGSRLMRASCSAVARGWSAEERRRYLGRTWRRPLRCG